MKYFYSKETSGFYSDDIHGDNIPKDAVEITEEWHKELLEGESSGKIITSNENGYPILVDPTPPTHEELVASVEAARKAAYANTQTGSDRLFAEAQRMQMMGESGWEAVRDAAIARYEEIKLEHPWPELVI